MDGIEAMAARPLRDTVREVTAWAFLTFCVIPMCYGIGSVVAYALCGQLLPMYPIPDAKYSALWIGLLCCNALQAAAATLRLLLPYRRRRIRRALAYLVSVVAIVGPCTLASVIAITADPGIGYVNWLVVRMLCAAFILKLMVFDLLCFLWEAPDQFSSCGTHGWL